MKRVRLSIDPGEAAMPPIYERLTVEADYLADVCIVNWNVAEPPVGFLLRFEGDYHRFEAELASDDAVTEWAVLPIDDAACHCYLAGETGPAARALFENFTRGSLLTVPPVRCHDDGSSTFTLVGPEADIQAAVADVPNPVEVTVEQVGGDPVATDGVLGLLSPRQREALEAAVGRGYYDLPRDADLDAVAAELDCATATAAEHLRKAERTVFGELVSG